MKSEIVIGEDGVLAFLPLPPLAYAPKDGDICGYRHHRGFAEVNPLFADAPWLAVVAMAAVVLSPRRESNRLSAFQLEM